MNSAHEGAEPVVQWMLSEGWQNTHAREFGDEMCRRIVAAGIPIWRGFCYVATLHPQVEGGEYRWNRDETGANRRLARRDLSVNPEYIQGPIAAAKNSHKLITRRLAAPDCSLDFPVLRDFKAEGATDYIAIPMFRSDGVANVIAFLTDCQGGFSDAQASDLETIAQTLGIVVELQSLRRIATSLLDTYIGHRTGQRVLSGAIARGSGETIRAVIWYCDLRGFTGLADRLPRQQLLDLLNQYFEVMAEAVVTEGGEVLKFIGDGMLAIFEVSDEATTASACRSALAAAREAAAAIGQCNSDRKAAGARPFVTASRSIWARFTTAILERPAGLTSR